MRGGVAGLVDGLDGRGEDAVPAADGLDDDFHFRFVSTSLSGGEHIFEELAGVNPKTRLGIRQGNAGEQPGDGGGQFVPKAAAPGDLRPVKAPGADDEVGIVTLEYVPKRMEFVGVVLAIGIDDGHAGNFIRGECGPKSGKHGEPLASVFGKSDDAGAQSAKRQRCPVGTAVIDDNDVLEKFDEFSHYGFDSGSGVITRKYGGEFLPHAV